MSQLKKRPAQEASNSLTARCSADMVATSIPPFLHRNSSIVARAAIQEIEHALWVQAREIPHWKEMDIQKPVKSKKAVEILYHSGLSQQTQLPTYDKAHGAYIL
jgi:hypothetical protein